MIETALRPMEAKTASPGTLFFVVGVWRSGTSLVHALLNRHPEVRLMYEAEPFDFLPRKPEAIWPRDWPQRLEFYNQTISRHQLKAADLKVNVRAREAALGLYRAYGEQNGAAVIGEKAPAYHACLPGIARVFPEARFLVIWRDPLECCRSAALAGRKNRFFSKRGMAAQMLFGSESLACGVNRLLREGARVHQIVYSEFIASPESHLRDICKFAQIHFDARMLDLKGADVSLLPAGEHHDKVRSGVIAAAAGGEDPLPAAFSGKGRRYAALWRGQFASLGFSRALEGDQRQHGPGWVESWSDRSHNLVRRGLDGLKRKLFRRIPLNWWARLRSGGAGGQTGKAGIGD